MPGIWGAGLIYQKPFSDLDLRDSMRKISKSKFYDNSSLGTHTRPIPAPQSRTVLRSGGLGPRAMRSKNLLTVGGAELEDMGVLESARLTVRFPQCMVPLRTQ